MLVNFILYIYITYFCFTYGLIFWKLSGLINKAFIKNSTPDFFTLIFTGFSFLMLILGYYSIFYPIAAEIHFGLLAIALAFSIKHFQLYSTFIIGISPPKIPKIIAVVLVAYFILFLFYSSSNILWYSYDTGLYHAKFVKWISEYKAVKGLGNLDGRLAFNSHFYLLTALFSFSFLSNNIFYALNGFFTLIFLLFILHSILKNRHRNTNSQIGIYVLLLIFYFLAFKTFIYSQYADISATIIILFIFFKLFEDSFNKEEFKQNYNINSIALLSFSAPILKLSSAFILLLPLFITIMFLIRKQYFDVVKIIILGTVVILPWLIRNVILSGYLIYPFPALDFFNFDWKIPILNAIHEKNITENFARFVGIHNLNAYSINKWLPVWWHKTEALSKLFLALFLSSILIVTIARINLKQIPKSIFILYLLFFCGSLYAYFQAPSIRFVFAPALACTFIACFILSEYSIYKSLVGYGNQSLLIIALLLCLYQYRDPIYLIRHSEEFKIHHLLLPEQYPTVKYKTKTINNLNIILPIEGNQCWNAGFMCIDPRFLDQNLSLRGKNIEDGFRSRDLKVD